MKRSFNIESGKYSKPELSSSYIEDYLENPKKEALDIQYAREVYDTKSLLGDINLNKAWNKFFKKSLPKKSHSKINALLEIDLFENKIYLPILFKELINEIDNSKYLLEFKENWDDEESKGYKENTWVKSIIFLVDLTTWIYDQYDKKIETPKIYHGNNGSIDILWENDKYRLLINIPEDNDNPATFYGDDYKKQYIKGSINPSDYTKELFYSLMK
jgi:hypothetical protein